jgi:DNA-binding transcriptional regulator YdaS (Cro superfamily)
MDLSEYLFKNRKTTNIQKLADQLKYSRTHLSQIVNGHSKPSRRLAEAIEKATNGEVKAEDLLKEE